VGTRNDDISLILAKAKKQGFLPDIKDSEVDILTAEARNSLSDDSVFTSGPGITINGDSLNAQGGGLNPPVAVGSYLAKFTDQNVQLNSVGGETSLGIAARQGGNPYLLLPAGGVIPASGGVVVTISFPVGTWPLLQTNGNPALGQVFVGTLAGIPGTLTLTQPTTPGSVHQADDYYTFTRTTSGSAVIVSRPAPFYMDFAVARRGDIHIIQAGRNNFSTPDQVIGDIAAMIHYLSAFSKKYLVVGVHNGTGEGNPSSAYTNITALNSKLAAAYGRRFLDYRAYMVSYGLADLSILPTANDLTDIAADTVPRSMLSDGLHFTLDTRRLLARLMANRLFELGWAPDTGKTFFLSDDFNRADSNNIGPAWEADTSFAIVSNSLTRQTVTGTPAVVFMSQSMPSSDQHVSAAITRGATNTSTGLVIRGIDSNNYYGCRINAASSTNNVLLYKVINGVTTSLSGLDNQWLSEGQTLTLKSYLGRLSVLINGTEILSSTDSSAELKTGLKVGVRCDSAGATKPSIDNFTAKVAII
jgi:hypothetical protein